MERLFRSGELLVVVCTATLAWGVNLPSQTVIIRGTDVFTDTGRQDLDILDVKQIFGRAGRPQFTASGEVGRGVILTTHDRLGYYMRLLNGETALESFLGGALSDVLNSEIVLGNISTVGDALNYVKRTFYNIRVVNTQEQVIWSLARLQATKLLYCDKTLTNDPDLTLTPTELGQICSYYYISFESLTSFIACLKETAIGCQVDYQDLLHYICQTPQFHELKPRQAEQQELMVISGSQLQQLDTMVNTALDRGKKATQINKLIEKSLFKQKAHCLIPILAKEDEAAYKVNILI